MLKRGEWKNEIKRHKNLLLLSILFLFIASSIDYLASSYVEQIKTFPVTDLILDHIPSIDLSFIYVYGFILVLAVLLFYPLFFAVKELHVVISQFSLLVMVRSFFVSLTHIGVSPEVVIPSAPAIFAFFDSQNALFFSGHTAVPFLGFLLFRKEKIGIFFLVMTIVLAVTVLLMHVHYSIDVFAAPLITYSLYRLGKYTFKRIKD